MWSSKLVYFSTRKTNERNGLNMATFWDHRFTISFHKESHILSKRIRNKMNDCFDSKKNEQWIFTNNAGGSVILLESLVATIPNEFTGKSKLSLCLSVVLTSLNVRTSLTLTTCSVPEAVSMRIKEPFSSHMTSHSGSLNRTYKERMERIQCIESIQNNTSTYI